MSEEKEVLKLILQKLTKLEDGQAELKLEVNNIKGQLEENTAILRALEHKTDVHKAEMDNLNHRVANLEGIVKEIRDDQKSFFEIIGEHDVSIRTLRRRA